MATYRADDVSPVTKADPSRKRQIWNNDVACIVVLCVLGLLTWLPRITGPIDLRWDAGVYYTLGTSLAHGTGYRLLNEPGNIQAIQYPPGLPALVALHQLVLRTDDPSVVGIWLRRSWCLMSLLYVSVIFLLSRQLFSRGYALLLALICLLNYQMIFLSTLCFAELPFALASVLFAYFYLRGPGIKNQFAAGAAAIAAFLLRTAGIALVIAWVFDAALRRQFRRACVRAAISLVPILLWQTYIHSVESSEEYRHPYYAYQRAPWVFYNVSYARNVALKEPFRPELGPATKKDLLIRFVGNLATMPAALGEAISSNRGFLEGHIKSLNHALKIVQVPLWASDILLVPLGLLVISGVISIIGGRQWLIYVVLSVAAICSTPWPGQFQRYLAPIEAFLLIAFLMGVKGFQIWARRLFPLSRIPRALPLVIITIVLADSAISCLGAYRNFRDPTEYEDQNGVRRPYILLHYETGSASENGLKWLVAHADRNAIVATSMPQWVYLKTSLKTVIPPLEPDPQKAQQMIDSVPATYLTVDRLLGVASFNQNLPQLMRSERDKWMLVYPSPEHAFDIYERVGLGQNGAVNHVQLPHGKSLRF